VEHGPLGAGSGIENRRICGSGAAIAPKVDRRSLSVALADAHVEDRPGLEVDGAEGYGDQPVCSRTCSNPSEPSCPSGNACYAVPATGNCDLAA